LTHAALWHRLQPVGGRHVSHVQADLDARIGSRTDHGKLFLAAQADVSLLRCDLERAESLDGGHQLVVDRSKRSLRTAVDLVEEISPAFATRLRNGRTVGLEDMMHQRVGIAVAHAQVTFQHVPNLAVFAQPARPHESCEGVERLASALFDVCQLGGEGFVHGPSPFVETAYLQCH
jgi:hypothetical protein